jgi:hypothetical protein
MFISPLKLITPAAVVIAGLQSPTVWGALKHVALFAVPDPPIFPPPPPPIPLQVFVAEQYLSDADVISQMRNCGWPWTGGVQAGKGSGEEITGVAVPPACACANCGSKKNRIIKKIYRFIGSSKSAYASVSTAYESKKK